MKCVVKEISNALTHEAYGYKRNMGKCRKRIQETRKRKQFKYTFNMIEECEKVVTVINSGI